MKARGFLTMIRNRLDREDIYCRQEYWDAKAAEYQDKSISMWPNAHLNALYHTEQMALIDEWLPDFANKHVLDVGCGMGRISCHLAERGAEVVGLDFSPKAVAIAQHLSPAGNPQFMVGSIFEIADEEKYNLITVFCVIAMACRERQQVQEVMTRLRRALKPGGAVLILEPIHKGFLHRVLDMPLRDFLEIMVETGFEVKHLRQLHFWPMRFALAFVPWPKWITTPCYHIGQIIMRLPGFRSMGDYKAIYAVAGSTDARPLSSNKVACG